MFLSKDFLDGDGGDAVPFNSTVGSGAWDPSGTTSTIGTGNSSMVASRPTTASRRPATAGGIVSDETEDSGTADLSAASRRQKMMQQRQKALMKKQQSGNQGASMVMANAPLPGSVTEALPPNTPTTPSGGSSRLGRTATGELTPLVTGRLLSSTSHMTERDEEVEDGLIAPMTIDNKVDKEEEQRRRAHLAEKLDKNGILPVFDPTPHGNGDGLGRQKFDASTIDPSDMKGFLYAPAPKGAGLLECRIVRDRGGLNKLYPKYTMETDSGVFLMTAKKQKQNKTSNCTITMSPGETSKESEMFLGKVRSDFMGLEFVAYGPGLNPEKVDKKMSPIHAQQVVREELVAIQYSSSLWGAKPRGPRKMHTVIPRVQPNGERLICKTLYPQTEGLLASSKTSDRSAYVEAYHNKAPKWNDQIGAFVLNFNKRVTHASVKNFQLTSAEDPDTVYLQFGRVGQDVFNLDFRYPLSPFQAFAICLSSFDYKLCCE